MTVSLYEEKTRIEIDRGKTATWRWRQRLDLCHQAQRSAKDCQHQPACACMCAWSCLTLCVPMDCSPPGSSVHGILQARILEWVAIPFSRGSSWPRDRTWVLCIAGRFALQYVESSWTKPVSPALAGRFLITGQGLPYSSNSKESACNAWDQGSIPGLGSSSGEVNGNPLQYSCLENSMDREAWRATGHGVAESQTLLSD